MTGAPDDRDTDPTIPRWTEYGLRRGVIHALSVYVCRVLSATLFELRVFGAQNLPRHGATLFASNHQSLLDPIILGIIQDRVCGFLAKDSLFRVPLLGWLIGRLRAFPIPRESVGSRRALRVCLSLLDRDRGLVFFPEGTRSSDGRLQPLRRGVGLIARRSGARIVPVIMRGTFLAWPRGAILPRPSRVEVHVGEAIHIEEHESLGAFVGRLEGCLRRLAIAAGAPELVGDGSWAEAGTAGSEEPPPPSSTISGADAPPRTAGRDSPLACMTTHTDGGRCLEEAR